MRRRDFLQRAAAFSLAALPIARSSSAQSPTPPSPRQWKLFDVAWIEHAGMCVCVRAGTDETAMWQKSEKCERMLREDRYIPRKFVLPVLTADGMSEVTYVATERSLARCQSDSLTVD